jgi:hypothetical protein
MRPLSLQIMMDERREKREGVSQMVIRIVGNLVDAPLQSVRR